MHEVIINFFFSRQETDTERLRNVAVVVSGNVKTQIVVVSDNQLRGLNMNAMLTLMPDFKMYACTGSEETKITLIISTKQYFLLFYEFKGDYRVVE